MRRSWLCALVVALFGCAPDGVPPDLDPSVGQRTIAPPRSELVDFHPPPPPITQDELKSARLDPHMIARIVDADPKRLEDPSLSPAMMYTLARLLLETGRTFAAEALLSRAHEAAPDNAEITRAWARVLVSLGRVETALPELEKSKETLAADPELFYVLGQAYLAREPRDQPNLRKAIGAWESLLQMKPGYRSIDGTTAEQIRAAVAQLRAELSGDHRGHRGGL